MQHWEHTVAYMNGQVGILISLILASSCILVFNFFDFNVSIS